MSNQFIPQLPGQVESTAKAESEHGPCLRVHHFLIWLFVAVVVCTILTTVLNFRPLDTFGPITSVYGSVLVYTLLILSLSLSITVCVLKVAWVANDVPFFDEAGHCLALETACLFCLPFYLRLSFLGGYHSSSGPGALLDFTGAIPIISFIAIIGIPFGIIYIRFSRKKAGADGWAAFCSINGIAHLLAGLYAGSTTMGLATGYGPALLFALFLPPLLLFGGGLMLLLTPLFFLSLISQDIKQKNYRHWTHWVGVFSYGLICLPPVAYIAYQFIS